MSAASSVYLNHPCQCVVFLMSINGIIVPGTALKYFKLFKVLICVMCICFRFSLVRQQKISFWLSVLLQKVLCYNPEMKWKKVHLCSREAGAQPESGESAGARSRNPNLELKCKNQKSQAN